MMSATVMLYCLVFLIGVLHVQDASGECYYPFSAMKMDPFDNKVLPHAYQDIGETILFSINALGQYQVTRFEQPRPLTTYMEHTVGQDAVFTERAKGHNIAVSATDPQRAISVCQDYANDCCRRPGINYTLFM